MHEYSDHSKFVILSSSISQKHVVEFPEKKAMKIIDAALEEEAPLEFLKDGFLLYGFFRP